MRNYKLDNARAAIMAYTLQPDLMQCATTDSKFAFLSLIKDMNYLLSLVDEQTEKIKELEDKLDNLHWEVR